MDPSMMNAQALAQHYFFYQPADVKSQQGQFQPHQMHPNMPIVSSTPVYSRPDAARCQQPPTLYSNVPSIMTPMASPEPVTLKPSMMLETEFRGADAYYPRTPPLSTSGSVAGSPGSCDVLQTPINPMFSGLENIKHEVDMENLPTDFCSTSPPLTPVYHLASAKAPSSSNSASDLSSCPSLSPSPPPYATSVASSEQDVDFCDPRTLTNPALAPGFPSEEVKTEPVYKTEQSELNLDNTAIVNDLLLEDQSDLESLHGLVNFEQITHSDVKRPRAETGSSIVFFGENFSEELGFCEDLTFPCLPSPTKSEPACDIDAHRDKRVKKSRQTKATMPPVSAAASGAQSGNKSQSISCTQTSTESKNNGSGSDASAAPNPPPANRRGRKQSLTEDPSKTFVCDLCNRRFRRQEHLKRHYRSLHTQEKPFECNECGKKFSRSDNLAQHARTHGSGAIVMDLIEDPEAHMFAQPLMGRPEDFHTLGKVLFQVAADLPGSASELSSEDDMRDNKKRKRSG